MASQVALEKCMYIYIHDSMAMCGPQYGLILKLYINYT